LKTRSRQFEIRIPKFEIGRVFLGLILALFAAEQVKATGLPSRKESWRKVQTAHFTLFGNASESTIREAGLNLERLRSVLSLLTSSAHVNAPVPTAVYVFKSDSAMKPYKPLYEGKPGNLAGYFLAGLDGNYIALATAWNEDPRPIVHHEYLHFFTRNNFKPLPVWLEEGLAEFYSTFQASSKEARIGRPIEHHVYRLRESGLMPLAKLFAVNQDSPDYHEGSRQGPFYAQSWALLHLLISGKPERKESFKRFLGLLQQGKSSDAAFRESYGVSGPEFLPELAGYIRRGRFSYSVLSLRELTVPTETKTESMTSMEVLCRLGDLLAHGPMDRLGPAEAHYAAALAEEPSHAGGLSGMGFVRYRQERYEEAGEFFRRAAASPGADFRAHYYNGWLLMRGLSREPLDISSLSQNQRETLSQARAAFRESLARNGDFAEARAELGRTYLFESSKDRAADGILWLEAALRLMPSREDVVLSLAQLYERSGNAAKSDEVRARFLGPEAASKLARQRDAQSSFQRGLDRVNALLEKRQEDEAIALFESLLAQAPEDVRQAFQDELTALRRGAASNRLIKEYNEGVALANKQDYKGALIRFRKVAAETDDFALAQAANERIREVSRWLSNRRPRKTQRN
jgi:hypothetical protein